MQKRAARFVTRNYSYETGSMTGILEELKWETLQKDIYNNIKFNYLTSECIPFYNSCQMFYYPKEQAFQKSTLVFQIPTASIDAYLKSFFPQTIRDWHVLPNSLITSAELSDDCVSKFTSLVRARD